jgi:hypothetical protein
MQDIAGIWHRFTDWLASLDLGNLRLSDVGQSLGTSIQNLSLWLSAGYRGITISLILLVVIVNRILKRHQ